MPLATRSSLGARGSAGTRARQVNRSGRGVNNSVSISRVSRGPRRTTAAHMRTGVSGHVVAVSQTGTGSVQAAKIPVHQQFRAPKSMPSRLNNTAARQVADRAQIKSGRRAMVTGGVLTVSAIGLAAGGGGTAAVGLAGLGAAGTLMGAASVRSVKSSKTYQRDKATMARHGLKVGGSLRRPTVKPVRSKNNGKPKSRTRRNFQARRRRNFRERRDARGRFAGSY